MENKTSYSPRPEKEENPGANTFILILIIIIIVAFGYWWYRQEGKESPIGDKPAVNVDINLPDNNPIINRDGVETQLL